MATKNKSENKVEKIEIDATDERAIEFMESDDHRGLCSFILKNDGWEDRGERQFVRLNVQQTTYEHAINRAISYGDDCVGMKFFPDGWLETVESNLSQVNWLKI